jgi:hypothetical protein
MTSYLVTPVGIGGVLRSDLAERVEGWDLGLIEENCRLRSELDEARREAAGAQRLRERFEAESKLRVRAQQRLWRVALALATIAYRCPEADKAVIEGRELIWRSGHA